jgi:hypothetical protein
VTKLLIETTGPFQLLDPVQGLIPAHRASVVEKSMFIEQRIGMKMISIIGEVSDEAHDVHYIDALAECEGDEGLCRPAFLAEFKPKAGQKDAARDPHEPRPPYVQKPKPAPKAKEEPKPAAKAADAAKPSSGADPKAVEPAITGESKPKA